MTKRKRAVLRQLTIFPRGGKQRRAGRKPMGELALAPHATRTRITERDPVHVTTHLVAGCPSLRCGRTVAILERALAKGSDRFGFHLVEYSVQTNHLHLLAESEDARALARGMQGLLVRIARALNRDWGRKGKVFRDRYHANVLKSPKAVRNALVYVLQNSRGHGSQHRGADAYSSGPAFGGWLDLGTSVQRTVAAAASWLLKTGWRRLGLIHTSESPKSALDR